LPLLERVRVEVYIPDLPHQEYWGLLYSFQEEFSYAFGGCSVLRGIDGSYLSISGKLISASALMEESVLISVEQVYHHI
jgi:hypothetical protein